MSLVGVYRWVLPLILALSLGTGLRGQITCTHFAGALGGPGFEDGLGSEASFNEPDAVATDRAGNTFVADSLNHTIRKITPAGNVSTIAGSPGVSGAADGPGPDARFFIPMDIDIDGSDNLFHRDIQFAASLVLLNGAFASEPERDGERESQKPNILYLLVDQWRASATGYAGDPNVRTPNLDRLAVESLNFSNAVSVLPVCTPHRAALMTGRYPTSTGMFLNDAHLPDEELCMAEILGGAGYATGYIGKWHLDGHGREAYIPPARRQGWQYWKGAECDHTYNRSHYYTGDSEEKRYWQGYDAFAQTEDARQHLRDHARGGQPFILMVAYGGPHFPHGTAPEEFKAMYPPGKIKLPPNVPPAMQAKARAEAQGYYAHCTALDRCVGDLMETLAETGLAKNTIVVFTSDHGEMLGSQGVSPTQKQVAWSESARVPLLMRVPGVNARKVTTPLTTPDILPTLLGLVAVAKPPTIEGEDLAAMLRAGRDEDRSALYMSVSPFSPGIGRGKLREYRAIRTSRYTYVRDLDGPWLLYDDRTDPYQTNNLVGAEGFAALTQEMDARLQAQLKRIGDDFRPGKDHLAEWGFQVGPHGSVPYAADETKAQTPRRSAAQPKAGGSQPTTPATPKP